MSLWNKLPVGILVLVFKTLRRIQDCVDEFDDRVRLNDGTDLGQCALTCRGWKVAAQNVRFSRLFITVQDEIDSQFGCLLVKNSVKIIYNNMCGFIRDNNHDLNLRLTAAAFPFIEEI